MPICTLCGHNKHTPPCYRPREAQHHGSDLLHTSADTLVTRMDVPSNNGAFGRFGSPTDASSLSLALLRTRGEMADPDGVPQARQRHLSARHQSRQHVPRPCMLSLSLRLLRNQSRATTSVEDRTETLTVDRWLGSLVVEASGRPDEEEVWGDDGPPRTGKRSSGATELFPRQTSLQNGGETGAYAFDNKTGCYANSQLACAAASLGFG